MKRGHRVFKYFHIWLEIQLIHCNSSLSLERPRTLAQIPILTPVVGCTNSEDSRLARM